MLPCWHINSVVAILFWDIAILSWFKFTYSGSTISSQISNTIWYAAWPHGSSFRAMHSLFLLLFCSCVFRFYLSCFVFTYYVRFVNVWWWENQCKLSDSENQLLYILFIVYTLYVLSFQCLVVREPVYCVLVTSFLFRFYLLYFLFFQCLVVHLLHVLFLPTMFCFFNVCWWENQC